MADTWNSAGTTFTAIKMDVTNTASAVGSKYLDLLVSGVSKFSVGKDAVGYSGTLTFIEMTNSLGVSGFQLLSGPNGSGVLPVPTFRPSTNNTTLAMDICPRGTPTDLGYGLSWFDICATDQILSGNAATQTLHMEIGNARGSMAAFIGAAFYTAAAKIPLYFGFFDGDTPAKIDSFKINNDATATLQIISVASVGNVTPSTTTQLLYAAGTTGKSPARFTSGVAPTSPVNGDFWFDGTNFKAQVGGATKTFTII